MIHSDQLNIIHFNIIAHYMMIIKFYVCTTILEWVKYRCNLRFDTMSTPGSLFANCVFMHM